ncbi:T9SS type A sorting domain-containing protein [Hyunsoonleella rubra]|uniref:T9SS type A sorting domain-containing protein n=1 Tax=Hyunsoonleella rubra TaxID=1737062 RepID=A0ABW5TD17_9FLAO
MKKTTFLKYFGAFCLMLLFTGISFGKEDIADYGKNTVFADENNLPYNLPLTPDFTVMAKIKINIAGSNLFTWSNEEGQVFSSITITDDFRLHFSIPAINYQITSHTSLESGCHHLAVVCDAGLITLYVNGVAEISTQINLVELAGLMGTVNPATIKGNLKDLGGFVISEFALFEDPLAQVLIQQFISSPPVITSDAEIGLLLAVNFNLPGMPFEGLSGTWLAEICTTLSSDDLDQNKLSVHPNPTSDYIKLSKTFANRTFSVHDILGKQLMRSAVGTNGEIDVRSLKSGMYFLRIDSERSVKFFKR